MGSGIKKLLPAVGTIAGGAFGGPVGAAIGGGLGSILSGPEKIKAEQISSAPFDVTKEAKPAQTALTTALTQQGNITSGAAPLQAEVLKNMGEAAAGRGPSLAEAQMKAAQERTLAQQLGAVQAMRGGSAAGNARALMQAQGAAGRNLAQEAAQARLQERNQFLTQGLAAQQMLGNTAGQQLQAATLPKTLQQQRALQQASINSAASTANTQSGNQLMGSLIGGAGTVIGSMVGKKDGGHIKGPGTETSDSIPARLSDGEFVVRAKEVKKPGMLKLLEAINSGELSSEVEGGSTKRKKFSEILMAQHEAHGDLLKKLMQEKE